MTTNPPSKVLAYQSAQHMPKITLTSQARKKIIDMKKTKPRQDGRLSIDRYMMNTQPSCDAASYTVKKLVAETNSKQQFTSPAILLKLLVKPLAFKELAPVGNLLSW